MLTEESLPNIIKTIEKKRTNENYHKILNDYIKNNSGILSTNKTNRINSSFFDNIINSSLKKKAKIKELLINISEKNNQIILKNYFLKWKTKEKELDSNIINNNSDFNNNDIKLNNNDIKVIDTNEESLKEKEVSNNNTMINDKKDEENIFKPYDDIMNNSIDINDKENIVNIKEIKKEIPEELKESKENKMNEIDNQIIEDEFDIRLNEEMILNQKENSKVKSDIFDSNDMNNISSIYLKDKLNINENILGGSQDKSKNSFKREITETNNEICNILNTNPNTQKESLVFNSNQNKNNEINNIKSKEEESINYNKNENEQEINKVKENREKFKEEIRKTFNKNFLFDSLDNKESINDISSYNSKNKNKNEFSLKINNTLNNIGSKKMKILNHFMTDDPITEKNSTNNNKSLKRCFYKISSTNNIFIKNEDNININKKHEKTSFNDTNLTKTENIFIKGNNNKINIENNSRKKLELFIIDKNNDIYINQNKKEIKKELNKNYNFILGNNIIKNNIYERLIDSNMITNFLNNTKNEPMFNKKNFNTIQCPNDNSKINLNINNIINFSINKSTPKIKTEENSNINNNTNKNVSFNDFKNNFVYERKNNFYLKKQLNRTNQNIKRANSNRIFNKNNLKLNELELMEPNIQKCPVSLQREQNSFYEERKSYGINNNSILDNIKKEYNTIIANKKKRKLPKSLSTELINGKLHDKKIQSKEKYNTTHNINKIKIHKKNLNNKTNFISEDLLNFIDCIKSNQSKEKQNSNQNIQTQKNDIYNFKEIKYNKINTYREKNKKQNKNSSLIVDSFKRIYNYKLNNYNNNGMRKETDKNNNSSVGKNNKNRNVDYKRLNELYLDYKVKDIKRNKLKNKQDNEEGITFAPHINEYNYKNFNKY